MLGYNSGGESNLKEVFRLSSTLLNGEAVKNMNFFWEEAEEIGAQKK